jgi:integrase
MVLHKLWRKTVISEMPSRLIMHIACHYGVHIRDILRCTIGDWRVSECQLELRVHRQVSRGQGVRMVCLPPATQSLLRACIHGERKDCDPEHRELSQLTETDPLFLTAKGRAYVYEAFVPQWETLCRVAGISLPPRSLRHWFVIRLLRQIEERTHDLGEQQRHKAALMKFMGWQSPKTLRVYELEYHRERFINELDKFEEKLFTNGLLPFNE